jgi:hypothetical protein
MKKEKPGKSQPIMCKKNLLRSLLFIGLLLVIISIWSLLSPSPASAQCETPYSSCVTCHGLGNHVTGMSEWDSVHANQDMCISCHAGNRSTMDKDLAHESLVAQPLTDIYTNCHSCHPSDYIARSSQMAATLNVTPDSCSTPTPVGAIGMAGEPPAGNIVNPNNLAGHSSQQLPSLVLIVGSLSLLAFLFISLRWLGKHTPAH